jgi:hypothetical protein
MDRNQIITHLNECYVDHDIELIEGYDDCVVGFSMLNDGRVIAVYSEYALTEKIKNANPDKFGEAANYADSVIGNILRAKYRNVVFLDDFNEFGIFFKKPQNTLAVSEKNKKSP